MSSLELWWRVATRNIVRRLSRYLVIGLLLVFASFTTVTFFAFQQESYQNIKRSLVDVLMGDVVVISDSAKATSYLADNLDWRGLKPLSGTSSHYEDAIESVPGVAAVSSRIRFGAVAQDGAKQLVPMFAIGIDPEAEARVVSSLTDRQGHPLHPSGNGVYLTAHLADRLGVEVGDTFTLVTDDINEDPATLEAKVVGIASMTGLEKYEMDYVYLNADKARGIIGYEPETALEFVVNSDSDRDNLDVRDDIQKTLDQVGLPARAYGWQDLGGLPVSIIEVVRAIFVGTMAVSLLIIFMLIIVTNHTLVNGRIRETGTLRALGMQRRDVVASQFLETFLVATVAAGTGTALGVVTTIEMSKGEGAPQVDEMMEFIFGGKSLHPEMHWYIPTITMALFVGISLIAAWQPAVRAARLRPVDAIAGR